MPSKNTKSQTPKPKERVLAIDPGFDRCGVAVMSASGIIFSDCIVTDKKDPHEKRLAKIGKRIKEIIEELEPTSLAMEKLFFNQNISTALKVAEARGVILYEAAQGNLSVYEYSPQDIKIAVTSYGKASKTDVLKMVGKIIKLPEKKKRLDDELDAIALGITHLATVRSILYK
jgi:crossover junction endodeoxyribonuclease RuvC